MITEIILLNTTSYRVIQLLLILLNLGNIDFVFNSLMICLITSLSFLQMIGLIILYLMHKKYDVMKIGFLINNYLMERMMTQLLIKSNNYSQFYLIKNYVIIIRDSTDCLIQSLIDTNYNYGIKLLKKFNGIIMVKLMNIIGKNGESMHAYIDDIHNVVGDVVASVDNYELSSSDDELSNEDNNEKNDDALSNEDNNEKNDDEPGKFYR